MAAEKLSSENGKLAAEQDAGLNRETNITRAHEAALAIDQAVTPAVTGVRQAELRADTAANDLGVSVSEAFKADEQLARGSLMAAAEKLSGTHTDEVNGANEDLTKANLKAKAMAQAARQAVEAASQRYDSGQRENLLTSEEIKQLQDQATADTVQSHQQQVVAELEQKLAHIKDGGVLRRPRKWPSYITRQLQLSEARSRLRSLTQDNDASSH